MNTHALAWAWQQGHRFDNPRVYLTLLALADHAGAHNECYPSRGRIAGMIGVRDKGTITRHIGELERMGLVKRTQEHRDNGGKSVNRYTLNIGESAEWAEPAAESPPSVSREEGTGQQPPREEPVEGTRKKEPDTPPTPPRGEAAFDPAVIKVWDHYCVVFQPERAKLGPSRARGIQRALQEVESADDLCVAVDGLFAYRKQRRGPTAIETIWKTYRGTGSMTERIDFFISQAPRSSRQNPGLPSADPAIVAQHKQNVQRGFHYSQSEDVVEQAKESEEWLTRHGIETVRRESDGYPIFPAPGDLPTAEDGG